MSTEQPEETTDGEGASGASSGSADLTANASGRNGSLEGAEVGGDGGGDSGGGDGGSGDGSGGGGGAGGRQPWYRDLDFGRRIAFPVMTVVFLVVLLIAFQQILLPFIFACALVYLMEPIVVRFSRTPENPRGLPRWLTVILVYLMVFGVVTAASVLVAPRLVGEVVRFAETVPDEIQKFRQESLPEFNERLQNYIGVFVPSEKKADVGYGGAGTEVAMALEEAADRATAFGAAQRTVHQASEAKVRWKFGDDGLRRRVFEPPQRRVASVDRMVDSEIRHGYWRVGESGREAALRVVPTDDRGMEVFVNSGAVEIARVGEERWTLRRPPPEAGNAKIGENLRGKFDLEEKLNKILEEAVTFSNEQLAELIEFIQHLIIGILEAFIAILMTLMVAAFISIDLPRFMGFFRSLVPEGVRVSYDELLTRVDRGLSGVIRGQLIICVVNGILTFIGLWLIEVKFAVLLAVIAGVFSIIPVFGAVISTIPICIIAATQSMTKAVLVLAWILGIHFLEGNILNPKIIGTSAEIHPVIVIFALLAGESTYGLVGAILAVPVASILLSLFKFFRDKVWTETDSGYVEQT